MSMIQKMHNDNLDFIRKRRNRQRVADLAGIHVNTVSDLIANKRPSPSLKQLSQSRQQSALSSTI